MRLLLPSALLTALALAVLPSMPQAAHAGTGVLRCEMPDGSHVYSDKACSSYGAIPAPLPGEVLNRIERDQRNQAAVTWTAPAADAYHAPASLAFGTAPAGRIRNGGCADSPQQLAMDLQTAVALGDVNRVAESYHWNGMGNAAAQRIMSRLQQLASRTILSVEYFDARMGGLGSGFADAGTIASDGDAGMLQALVSAEGGSQVLDFSVQRAKGCYFASY